jgi:hypothetical protein
MHPSEALNPHRDRILEIVLSHRVTDPRVFGFVLLGDDTHPSPCGGLMDSG